jgi:hypothetical protein
VIVALIGTTSFTETFLIHADDGSPKAMIKIVSIHDFFTVIQTPKIKTGSDRGRRAYGNKEKVNKREENLSTNPS